MKRVACALVVFAAVATFSPAFSKLSLAQEEKALEIANSEYGKYFCYVTNMAGIQGEGNQRHGTAINPGEANKLFLTIRRIERPTHIIYACKKSMDYWVSILESGKNFFDRDDDLGHKGISRELMGPFCFAQDEAIIKYSGDDHEWKYKSYDLRFEFYSGISTDSLLVFGMGLKKSYMRTSGLGSGNIYVEEGQCEKIN